MNVESHKDLDVWKRSMDLVTEVYRLTQKWPVEEKYGLTSQLRRAAVSIRQILLKVLHVEVLPIFRVF